MTQPALRPTSPGPRGRRGGLAALRVRNFRLFWVGQLVSGIGTWMQTVAMAWLVLQISGSPAVLGMVTTLQFLPMLLFVLPAGVLADRVSKRKLLLVAQALAAAQALALGVLTAMGTPQIWQLAALGFTLGLSNALNNPTQQAFVSEMVGPTLVPDAVALNSVQFNITRMLGSALGGVLVALLGAAPVFLINAASFTAALVALVAMRPQDLLRAPARRATGGSLMDGIRYALGTPQVLFVLGALAVVGTFGFNWPVAAPLLARDVLDVQAAGFGALMGAFGAGALIAGLGLIMVGPGGDRRLVGSGGLLGIVLIALGQSGSYPASLVLMGLAGVTGTVFTTTANTRLQLLSPDHLRGRIMSLFVLLMAGTTPIGASLMGGTATALGVPATMAAFGLATLAGLVTLVAGLRWLTNHRPDAAAAAASTPGQ